MSTGWDNYTPAPIEVFHGEALDRFHVVKDADGKIDGIGFNNLIAEFKVKIMKEYGISGDAIPKRPYKVRPGVEL
jgi:hypothetical protein